VLTPTARSGPPWPFRFARALKKSRIPGSITPRYTLCVGQVQKIGLVTVAHIVRETRRNSSFVGRPPEEFLARRCSLNFVDNGAPRAQRQCFKVLVFFGVVEAAAVRIRWTSRSSPGWRPREARWASLDSRETQSSADMRE